MTGLLGTIAAILFALALVAMLGPAITHQIAGLILVVAAVVALAAAGVFYHLRQLTERADRAISAMDEIKRRIDARETGDIDRHADDRRMADAFDALAQRRKTP